MELVALMGAERLGSEPHPSDPALTIFSFRQKVPIPSYLTALVVGALESKSVGGREGVREGGRVGGRGGDVEGGVAFVN